MAEGTDVQGTQLNCPICLETFESPKAMACFHTFCEKCICKHVLDLGEVGTQSDTITCPMCRNPTPAPTTNQSPDEWAAKLATNTIVLSLLASPQSNKDYSVYCQPCLILRKQKISVAYCVTCLEYLCQNCYGCHQIFKATKDHTITAVSVPDHQNWNSSQDTMYLCSIHLKKFKYFCQNHKELCCRTCAFNAHRQCEELLPIENLSKNIVVGDDFKESLENIITVKEMFITLRENRSKYLKYLKEQNSKITQSIKQRTDAIKYLVDKLEAVTLKDSEQMFKQETITASDQIAECMSIIAAIETSEKMLIESSKLHDHTKIYITIMKVSQQLVKYLENYDLTHEDSESVEFEFHPDSTSEEFIRKLNSLGQVMRTSSKVHILPPNAPFVISKIMRPRAQPEARFTFSAKIPSDGAKSNVNSGVFLPGDKLVLCDKANRKLKLFDGDFQYVSHINMDDEPEHICRMDHCTVAVTVAMNIDLVSVNNSLIPLRKIFVGRWCYGITFCRNYFIIHASTGFFEGDSLLKCDSLNHGINEIKSFDDLSCQNTHCVSPDGQLIYYTNKNKIVAMDIEGKKLYTFQSNDLKQAHGITVDKKRIIYSCGKESKTVVQVTPEGRQLGVVLSHNYGLINPTGICLNDKNDMIIIFEEQLDEIKVFKLI